jgi:sugar/nucleoside kinase (ribokinase family)
MKIYDAAVAGYTCVDLIPDFGRVRSFARISDLFRPGKLIETGGIRLVPGGVVPNTGLALKKFNKRVFLSGLVGNDFMGRIVLDWLSEMDLSEGMKITDKSNTAYSIVLAPPGLDRIFLESTGCNRQFNMESINIDAVSRSRIFHFGYPPLLRQFYLNSGSQLVELYSRIQKMGVVTSLDLSLPDKESESGKVDWNGLLRDVFPHTDLFVPSLEEIMQMMSVGTDLEALSSHDIKDSQEHGYINVIREIGYHVISLGVKILLIKAGCLGMYLLTGDIGEIHDKLEGRLNMQAWNNRELWCTAYPADPSKIVNSSGAGDTAIAAFLAALLNGEEPVTALKYAAIAGRNRLYCLQVENDLPDWQHMTHNIFTDHHVITIIK